MGEENCYARSHYLKLLRIVMVLVGVIFIAGIYPLMMPSGWTCWGMLICRTILYNFIPLGVFLHCRLQPAKLNYLIWLTV